MRSKLLTMVPAKSQQPSFPAQDPSFAGIYLGAGYFTPLKSNPRAILKHSTDCLEGENMDMYKTGVCVSLRTALDIYLQLQNTSADKAKTRVAERKVNELVDILHRIEHREQEN